MPVRLENLTARPVLLVLPSGRTLRLSPGELSAELAAVEVEENAKVEKLVARGVVALRAEGRQSSRPARKGTKPGSGY